MESKKTEMILEHDLDNLSELQNLQVRYVDVIEKLKNERIRQDESYGSLKQKYERLKADFLYNMQLIQERDTELTANEKALHEYNFKISSRDKEISDLKVKVDELKICIGSEAKAREELQLHYQQRIREKQKELEQYRSEKDVEVTRERNELEIFKRNLDRQVRELEEELDIQHRRLTSDYDEAARKQEHEFRVQLDQLNNTLLGSELKVKLLLKELDLARAASKTSDQEVKQVENVQSDLKKQLNKKEWELEEVKAIKDARISDLEDKISRSESSLIRHEEEFIRKYSELDETLKRKESELVKVRDSWKDREQQLSDEIHMLASRLDESAITIRQMEWNLNDAVKEKTNIREKLESEIADIKTRWERHVKELSRDSVTRDVHVNALREAEEALKDELLRRKQDIEQYKKELADSLERETVAEQAKVQLELDWQRQSEKMERLCYQKSEDLVRNLTKSRDDALANVALQKSRIEQMEQTMKMLQQERDQAVANVTRYDPQTEAPAEDNLMSSEVFSLRERNRSLQAVILQMKEDMESVAANFPAKESSDVGSGFDKDYVKSLLEELSSLRIKCRELELKVSDLEAVSGSNPQLADDNKAPVHENAAVNAHMEHLNNILSSLRKDKIELTAQLRKQQTVVIHLQGRVDQLSKQPMEKQGQIDQLQYELNACKRRNETEVLSLRQRISDLELQVTEARKEADEYYRASTESNAEVTALSKQVAQLKLEIATSNPAINFGAQELVIQQLEDVIAKNANKSVIGGGGGDGAATSGDQETVELYKDRLKMAVKDLIRIAQKNKVLTEINNRLLAEMSRNGIRPSMTQKRSLARQLSQGDGSDIENGRRQQTSLGLCQAVQNKLQQLEELQYQITKQELAKRGHEPLSGRNKPMEDDEEYQPQSILKNAPNRLGPDKLPLHSWNSTKAASSNERGKFQPSDSSVGEDSLREIWDMIGDDDSGNQTPRTGKSRHAAGSDFPSPRGRSGDSWTVTGSQPPMTHRQKNFNARQKSASSKPAKNITSPRRKRPVAVNYNKLRVSKDSL